MMYFSLGSLHCELMRTTFSVMLSMVRSFNTGTDLLSAGPDILYFFLLRLMLLLLLQWLTFF